MPVAIIILIRILFAACMVFIIGYVFGNFSKNATPRTITKFASILAPVLFIAANVFFSGLVLGIPGISTVTIIVAAAAIQV
jgi:hypothetical protein